MNGILRYGVVHLSQNESWLEGAGGREVVLMNGEYEDDTPGDYDVSDECHVLILFTLRAVGIRVASIKSVVDTYRSVSDFIAKHEQKHGADAHIIVRKDLIFDVRDKGFSYDDFAVYCAINSYLNRTMPIRVIRQTWIANRALGYKSQAVYDAEMPNREDKAVLLRPYQITRITDRLERKGFITKFFDGKRTTRYSHRSHDKKELLEDAVRHATKSLDRKNQNRELQREFAERVKQAKT